MAPGACRAAWSGGGDLTSTAVSRLVAAAAAVALALAIAAVAGCSDDTAPAEGGAASSGPEHGEGAGDPSATAAPSTTTTAPVDVHALRPPPPAGDPVGLAGQIAEAESVLRDPAAGPAEVAAAALAQQVAYRQLGDRPEWDGDVLAALPEGLRPVAESHAAARRDLRALAGEPATEMPAWRIVAPAPAADLLAWYHEAEASFGVPWSHLAAINLVETAMGRIRGTSVAGAQGPMQFMPATWDAYGEGDVNDPRQAILGAARYLSASGAPGDMAGALWNYNHSDRYVRAVQRYADLIAEHPGAYAGFHGWGVWYWTTAGDLYLPVGWEAADPVPVDDYVATAG